MRLQRMCSAGERAKALAGRRLASAEAPETRAIGAGEIVSQALATGNVEDLPAQILGLTRTLRVAAEAIPHRLSRCRCRT
jgi:hypothetical protein